MNNDIFKHSFFSQVLKYFQFYWFHKKPNIQLNFFLAAFKFSNFFQSNISRT